ncbi:hypothetical protein F4604DRAFT_1678507 [Suillus subluteus]|nr:hypothetical protein F4604DRAFT_1678507 [Suillus subluteus]
MGQVQALWSICENLQHEVNCLKCGHKDDGDKADDEDEPTDKGEFIKNECLDTAIFDVTGTSMDTIETDDSDGGDGGEDLREGVQAMRNKKIIDRAANIVWNEQNFTYVGFGKDRDAETCTLRHKDISFMKKDIVAFAKDKFWNLKRKYAEVSETEGGEQEEEVPFARIEWTYLTLLLETEYMSEELSELETDNEEEKKAHHKILLQKAGFVSGLRLLVL